MTKTIEMFTELVSLLEKHNMVSRLQEIHQQQLKLQYDIGTNSVLEHKIELVEQALQRISKKKGARV